MHAADWLGVASIGAIVTIALVGGLWRIANLLGTIAGTLRSHDRRIQVLETAATEGRTAARKLRREHESRDSTNPT